MEREVKIITTEDGSHSLYLPDLNETYHSSHGALTESRHVFIEAGLDHFVSSFPESDISILEIGFGTGLNALLAYEFALEQGKKVHFTSLEPFSLEEAIYSQLNYGDQLDRDKFLALHKAAWDEPVELDEFFVLEKRQARLEDYSTDRLFDVVFFDAFAPNKQAELWALELLSKTVGFMASKSVLVTYCAKGQFKRDLASLNLEVETLPGPPGKKEMVRAKTY